MKMSAATKMTNLPTGAHPMPIYVAVSDSKTPEDKAADYGADGGAESAEDRDHKGDERKLAAEVRDRDSRSA